MRGFESRKALALLGYLAVQGQPVSRQCIVDLLWGDKSEARGRANLSWVLNRISTLLPDCLQADRHSVQFQRTAPSAGSGQAPSAGSPRLRSGQAGQAPYWLDIEAFEELEAQGDAASLAAAVELYRGELLEGLYLHGCAEFEIWLVGERERWRQRVARVLEALVTHHSQRGERQQSLRFAQRLLALEPWREETHRQVMRLLAYSDQRGAALAQYETCRRVLAEELGVEPAAETTTLYERIQAATPHRHNLPAQPTPFVGREEELAEIVRLLDNPDCRLLTVLGPGGIGKTRLALQVAVSRTEAFLEGVYFVPLAGVGSADFVPSAIADALQFSFSGPQDPRVQLLNYLHGKEVLLILDSFEHLLRCPEPARPELVLSRVEGRSRRVEGEGTKLLVEILQKAPEVKLFVTSRERLNLRWERCFEIGGLEYPASETTEGKELEDYSAVQLFQQTAHQVHQRFSLSARDRSAVARICQLVEGMPLGIELAAAWVRTHTCGEIAGEIERNLGFLAMSRRDAPERHRSARATFEHSWRLLTPSEQRAFMKLSVFRRGFSREAASAVAGASPTILESLMDKSLLRFSPSGRYEMHELLRQYAAEKLVTEPEAQTALRDQHCAYYTGFLQRRETDLIGARVAEALAAIGAEIANVRTAWQWAATQAKIEKIERSLNGLARFYLLAGPFQEGEMLIGMAVEQVRASLDKADKPKRDTQIILSRLRAEQARILNGRGMYGQAITAARAAIDLASLAGETRLAVHPKATGYLQWGEALWRQGDFEAARTQLEQALGLARAASTLRVRLGAHEGSVEALRSVEVESLRSLGNVSVHQGDYPKGRAYYEQSLGISREIGDRRGEADALNNLAIASWDQGDYAEARAYCEQSLRAYREIGDRRGRSRALNNLGDVCIFQGNYAEARAYYEQALRVKREIGDQGGEGVALLNLGEVCIVQGNYAEARAYLEQSLRIFREIGDRRKEAFVLDSLGVVFTDQGDCAEARTYCEQALQTCRQTGDRRSESRVLLNLGYVFHQQGDYARARAHYEQSLGISREIGLGRGKAMALSNLSLLSHHLGDDEAAREFGQQALLIAQEIGDRHVQGRALTRLGHALAGLGHLGQAAEVYQQAMNLRRELCEHNRAMESLAGLARVSLAQGNLPQAQAQVEEILNYLETNTPSTGPSARLRRAQSGRSGQGSGHGLEGTDEPFRVYLTCYHVLRANQDLRAQEILVTAHRLLQEQAAKISDEEMRRSFLENVAAHREIVEEMRTLK